MGFSLLCILTHPGFREDGSKVLHIYCTYLGMFNTVFVPIQCSGTVHSSSKLADELFNSKQLIPGFFFCLHEILFIQILNLVLYRLCKEFSSKKQQALFLFTPFMQNSSQMSFRFISPKHVALCCSEAKFILNFSEEFKVLKHLFQKSL